MKDHVFKLFTSLIKQLMVKWKGYIFLTSRRTTYNYFTETKQWDCINYVIFLTFLQILRTVDVLYLLFTHRRRLHLYL